MSSKNINQMISSEETEEDEALYTTLRPKKWEDFIGQEKIKKNLKIIIKASQKRKEPCCEHILFYGNQGLGKTSLSHLVAQEIGSDIKVTTGPTIERTGDFAAILTNLSQGDVLFIDEIHRLYKTIEEFLYSAMEEYKLHIILGKGPMARTMDLCLPKFTLVGATTKLALLSSPLRNRFGAIFQLDFYDQESIEKIIQRSADLLKIKIKPEAIKIIAKRSRFTPRVANRLLKRTRDWAQVEANGIITEQVAENALEFLEIDELGLGSGDRKILLTIIEKFNGGPIGLQTLSAASSEEEGTILDIYEPYLMQSGFIKRTPRGRVVTESAYKHLNIKYTGDQKKLI
ncbi:MAG: Holliday junction branch migration DNA helicase RuvB [Candidatus Pacebacteria bacterium]|nr:Holliday junction branch migration DNA helicase RuvB [Candidatus Paceibacterota bacterium]